MFSMFSMFCLFSMFPMFFMFSMSFCMSSMFCALCLHWRSAFLPYFYGLHALFVLCVLYLYIHILHLPGICRSMFWRASMLCVLCCVYRSGDWNPSVIFLAITATWCQECGRGNFVLGENSTRLMLLLEFIELWFNLSGILSTQYCGEFSGEHCQYFTSVNRKSLISIFCSWNKSFSFRHFRLN